MRLPISATARLWAVAGLCLAASPALAQLGGPANPPPASYQGMQFVDQNGCLFLRAGFGAQTVWVPMVNEARKPICGMAPTGTVGQVAAAAPPAEPAPAPASAPAVPAAPVPAPAPVVVASAPAAAPVVPQVAAPVAPPLVAPVAAEAPRLPAAAPRGYQTVAIGSTTASCPDAAPVMERVVLRNGGTALVCTQGDGTLSNWVPPRFAAGAAVGAALGYTMPTAANLRGARIAGPAVAVPQAAAIPTPPKGWKLAWKDDRLNPLRGVGTAEGQAAQDQKWTRDVPAQAVTQPRVQVATATDPAAAPAQPVTRLSTMTAPATAPLAGTFYVQIGSFGVPANAAGATAQVQALGLPAASGHLRRSGKDLQTVFAGPFASRAEADAALRALRGAGFSDAYIR